MLLNSSAVCVIPLKIGPGSQRLEQAALPSLYPALRPFLRFAQWVREETPQSVKCSQSNRDLHMLRTDDSATGARRTAVCVQ